MPDRQPPTRDNTRFAAFDPSDSRSLIPFIPPASPVSPDASEAPAATVNEPRLPFSVSSPSASLSFSSRLTRGALLRVGLSALPLLLLNRRALADDGLVTASPVLGTLPAHPSGRESSESRLLKRVSYGAIPEERARYRQLGYSAYLEYQLNADAIDDSAVENYVAAQFPSVAQTLHEINLSTDTWPYDALTGATLYRAAFSRRQLYQRMVEFWTDHFNISFDKVGPLKVVDDREAIRKHALGTFPDLLRASAHSVAMLEYLDNIDSYSDHPNQNYAREMMELHTLGVNGGYTQQDVKEVARCLTGWSRVWDSTSPDDGAFIFYDWAHDYDAKTVLGQTIAAGDGQSDGETVLDILAASPATALFVTTKMTRWLLGSDPAPALSQQLVSAYQATGGDIKALIRIILRPAHLMQSPVKLKRPFHLMASSLRQSGAQITNWDELSWRVWTIGQPPFEWAAPNGYPDATSYWGSALLPRWNFVANLADNYINGVNLPIADLMALTKTDDAVSAINSGYFGGNLTALSASTLQTFLAPAFDSTSGVDKEQRLRDGVGLALAFPEYQMY